MYNPTHETDIRPGTRNERTGHWRAASTMLEVRFATPAEAIAAISRNSTLLSDRTPNGRWSSVSNRACIACFSHSDR